MALIGQPVTENSLEASRDLGRNFDPNGQRRVLPKIGPIHGRAGKAATDRHNFISVSAWSRGRFEFEKREIGG